MSDVIKWMHSGMLDSPALGNNFGDLVNLLDACLVNGFGLRAVDSITRSGSTATALIGSGHPYQVDQVVLMGGADQPEYNGEVKVTAITAGSFSYTITGTPATPATTATSFSAKVAPLGFEKVFSATHKAAYRSLNVLSNRPFLRVDNSQAAGYPATAAKYAKVTICENMTGIDTIVGARAPFDPLNPTRNETPSGSGSSMYNGWGKWYHARSLGGDMLSVPETGNRNWVLVGDDRGFYLHNFFQVTTGGNNGRTMYYFGDINSLMPTDAYDSVLACHASYETVSQGGDAYPGYGYMPHMNNNTGKFLMQPWNQIGGAQQFWNYALNFGGTISGNQQTVNWPNGPNYGLVLSPIYIMETGKNVRGSLPGYYFCPQDPLMNDLTVLDNVSGLPGRKVLKVDVSSGSSNDAAVFYDITGPWR